MPRTLIGLDALDFVKEYFPVVRSKVFSNEAEVVSHCKRFPVILKLSSEKLVHKTEADAVVKVVNKKHLLQTIHDFKRIAKKLKAKSFGFLVQDLVSGVELLLGIKNDVSFGHVVVFGVGGVFVELFRDVQFRAVPLAKKDAEDMISQLKNKSLLEGFRNLPRVNKDALIKSILAASRLAVDHPEIKELDINPLICNNAACKAVDVRIVLDENLD